ncbi:glycoside hydrolase family 16 protein [Altererythrobacter sp. BO-6]|uniref:glycoside hydrolase family 16 protein n=1 Tax=Altererythrobacter sp. BO-6 TaxID=2604537 RepID=UPI0013E15207|nr:glycoside hydrolase family 16 protein [Altererythrobacter sp. BO-6]QIG53659.1 glycoside hydrolase family 16 protein [Altererythrobacter sp. BO-6]
MFARKFLVSASAALLAAHPAQADHHPISASAEARTLVFADEFDDGALDRSKWNVVGPEFWVNNEQQAYLDSPETIRFADDIEGAEGGVLVLRPVYKPGVDTRKDRKADFISGRINSQGKFDFTYGRAEARIKLPDATGVWPAWWLLGNGKWPETGEIDIMEYVGEKDWIGVAMHGPGYSGETPLVNKYFFPEGQDVTGWHVYAVEWTKDSIEFEIDGQVIYRVTRPMVEFYGEWRFDTPQHLILNFAVGGIYPLKTNGIKQPYVGVPEETVDQIKTGEIAMLVDWVRVYAPAGDKPAE